MKKIKKMFFDQKKADLLGLISKIGEKISSDEKHPGKIIDIGCGTTALTEICSKHIEYYFSVGDILKYFSAIDSTIERLEKELQRRKRKTSNHL